MNDRTSPSQPAQTRRYDKGERRRKHVAAGDQPQLIADSESPRKVIGKCPSTITDEERNDLLQRAVPRHDTDRELEAPKKIYAVYEGAIYEAQTSDHGRSYHAYPFKGKLGDVLLKMLREMAQEDGFGDAFEEWRKRHITRHGK